MPQGAVRMPILGEARTSGVLDTPQSQKIHQKNCKKKDCAAISFELVIARFEDQRHASRPPVSLIIGSKIFLSNLNNALHASTLLLELIFIGFTTFLAFSLNSPVRINFFL